MLEVNATLRGHSGIDFDKKKMRKALRTQGGGVRKDARRLVSRRAVSGGGENPGRGTGALWRSIKVKVYASGMAAIIAPQRTSEMGKDFYPAYLIKGVRRGAQRKKDHQAQADNGKGWRIERRNDFMMTALYKRSQVTQDALLQALKDSLKPR